jgi:hypothetical protein
MKTPFKFKPKVVRRPVNPKHDEGIHSWKDAAKEVGVIAGGSFVGGAAYDGIKKAAPIKKKNTESPREFAGMSKAAWVGTIAAGDVIGEGTLEAIKNRKKKVRHGVQKTTAVPGSGPTSLSARIPLITFFIKKPDPYIIRRATLRGKKPVGVPKIKKFEDERKQIHLQPKKNKSETLKNVAVGTGAAVAGAGVGYGGYKIGRAADTADKLQRHVGLMATQAHHKASAHVDYIGHHAAEAAKEATRTARATRKTATAYHPRAVAKMVGGKLKRAGAAIKAIGRTKIFSGKVSTTNFNAMKEKHPSGEEDKDSFLKRNGVRIAGTAAGIAGTALFYKHFKPVKTAAVKTDATAVAAAVHTKPGEKKIRRKPSDPGISNIRKVRKPKPKKMSAIRRPTYFSQPRDTDNKFGPQAELVPSFKKAKKIVQVGKRGGDVAEDLHNVVRGKPGDPKKKKFWEKAWFQTGALSLAGALAIRKHRQWAEKKGVAPYFSWNVTPTEFSKLTDAITHHKLVMATKRRILRIASHPLLQRNPKLRKTLITNEQHKYRALVQAQPHMALLEQHVTPTELAFLIHDDAFPIVPLKQPKLPKGMKQRVPNAETRAEVIKRMQDKTELSGGGGAGKVVAETIIDGTTIGADLGPKKKKSKAKKAADDADPDLTPTNNWTADPQANVIKTSNRTPLLYFAMKLPVGIPPVRPTPRSVNHVAPKQDFRGQSTKNHGLDKFNREAIGTRLHARMPLLEFYGTSDGVTKSWDTRGRSKDKAANGAHWWTHSPTKNSVRVVRSTSESGPRTRRGKKFHEKTSTHKAAIAVASGAALGLGGIAAYKHGKLKALEKQVHIPGHTVNVVNRKGQPPVYVSQKHSKPAVSPTVVKAKTRTTKPGRKSPKG